MLVKVGENITDCLVSMMEKVLGVFEMGFERFWVGVWSRTFAKCVILI